MDPIADMLTRIRNAQAVGKASVEVPYSELLWNIAKLLEGAGYAGEANRRGRKSRRFIELGLKYENGKPAIQGLKRVSRPSRRVYRGVTNLPMVRQGFGIAVVSTPKGVMTVKEAKKARVGGEVLLEIW